MNAVGEAARVVKCEGVHVDGVESELVVRSPHSTEGQREATEGRTLLLHAGSD